MQQPAGSSQTVISGGITRGEGLQATGLTDRGKVRNNNEDRFLIIDDEVLHLIAVADGMGGHAAGEIASSLAVESVRSYLPKTGGYY